MSGVEIINHPLRDEPRLKTKNFDHSTSSVITGDVSENTVVCTYNERHRIYSSRHYPVMRRYASSCTDLSSIYSDHVGIRNYQSSPPRRARTENKKINDHSRSSVNTREVSEGSLGVNGTSGPALLVLMARCKTRKTFTSTRGRTGKYSSPATQVPVKAYGATFV